VRPGGMDEHTAREALTGQYHFDPATYEEMIRADIPVYDELQAVAAEAAGTGARRILELGTGTGQTARRLLEGNPASTLVGIDESESMLAVARAALPAQRASLRVGRLEEPLPDGEFDLVASALCVHHLDGAGKRDLFARVRERLAPGGRFVLADVVVPLDPADQVTELTPGYDQPDTLADQLRWLGEAGFSAVVRWSHRDLAVVLAEPV
jgi:tRNA (cmo5U34)-methyltransferase